MKPIQEFLSEIAAMDIKLHIKGNGLRCNAPPGVLTSEIRTQLAERKAEIVKFLQETELNSSSEFEAIFSVNRNNQPLPLSWAQERLWFLKQLEGASATYNEFIAIRIIGKLNIIALEKAFSEIVRRHQILHSNFKLVDNTPVQLINPEAHLKMSVVDLRQLSELQRKNLVKQLAQQEKNTNFNLETDLLLRVKILQLSTLENVLFVTAHHIVCDGWSTGLFIKEFSILYEAFCLGKDSPLQELPIQYGDFAVWQRQWLSKERLQSQLNYWKQQLDGAPSLLQLPTDRNRRSFPTFEGATESFTLNPQLTQKLRHLTQQSGATLFMTLLAAFATLLYRYSGQSDIVIGSPIANRNRKEIEPLIGFFVNNLALRTRFEKNPSFKELLTQVRETALKAYEYQDVPFEKVVEILQPQRELSHSPLFQVMFVLQKAPMGKLELPGVTLNPEEIESTNAKFDLTLSIKETANSLVGSWEYNTDLFDRETIERMVLHFQNLLFAIVENPQQKVNELPLLSQAELHQLLVEWNNTATIYPQDKCIHQLFEEQVEKTPDAVAVVFEGEQLTYQQLNTRANQLAHHLKTLGVRPEVLVGICVERSLEMVVGLLGILKSGGAYVPLDPSYPKERLSYMLADSAVSVLLTQESLLSLLPKHQAKVVCLDIDWQAIEQLSEDNRDTEVKSNNLAYVIYTSGSTGQPKGVQICHRSVVNFLNSMSHFPGLTWEDTFNAVTTISFDIAALELYLPLTLGAKLIIASRKIATNADWLLSHLLSSNITVMQATPATWQMLLAAGWSSNYPLKVWCGGEALPPQLAKQILETGSQLWNLYGPTEATIWSTVYQVGVATTENAASSIGRPIANTQIYILDKHLQPVPIGVPGELYIGGDGLARGYLNRPALTQEKFIPNPLANSQSERLYKTGDLARYLPDGNIEFLGRVDNQVKIRGFRIELGEIEAALNTHPHIQQAIVIATEEISGNKRLVAYVVSNGGSITTKQLTEFLKQKLPGYMVPSVFVILDTLPLTPNGKVDRKALPLPDGEISREYHYVAPRTPSEEIIANIFTDVLSVQNVGIHDNFFELGGHSLLATQLISRLRVAFEVEIELRKVFEFPTVAQLEQTLTQLRTQEQGLSLPPIQPRTTSEQLPLSFAQERLWFLNQLEGASATYNIAGAIRISGNLDISALQQALSEIVHRHEVLRTSFLNVNGTPIQVIHPQATINIKVVDLQQLQATEREIVLQQQVQLEANTPFDLETAPLIRCSLWQLDSREYVLLLNMHHIVSDGWSIGIFTQELSSLYQAFGAGEPSPLAELPIQYADFAVWQRQWLSGQVLETQLNYWVSQLEGAPELLQLPTDCPRPVMQTYRGATYDFSIDADLTQKLQALSRKSGTTLFMTLLATFATLLYRYSGQSDILIGSPIANRNQSQIESLIGFFVNTLVLRNRFEDHPSFEELLAQVRETTLKAYEYQDVPFEQVVEVLQPRRSLSHSPLFQVMFVLQNAPLGKLELPGCSWCELDQQSTIAKFDLTLSITETNQGLLGSWEYNTDLFDGSTIERMAGHFHNLLSAIVDNPQQTVGELPLLSAAEHHQLLVEWNNTATEYPRDKCIHQLFEQQVKNTPDAVAVVFEGERLTYGQLNKQANQLAHYLRSLGVDTETIVGIFLDKSLNLIFTVLGIFKSGAAYLPLDPSYPSDRLKFMLEDTNPPVIITTSLLKDSLPSHNAKVICLDIDQEILAQQSSENPSTQTQNHNLAYIIYTSGSTGKPKGVMIKQRSLVNAYLAWEEAYRLTTDTTSHLQMASFSFDVFAGDFVRALCSGAKLVLCPRDLLIESKKLYELMLQEQVDCAEFVPAVLRNLVKYLESSQQNLGFMKLLSAGSDSWYLSEYQQIQNLCGSQTRLINSYGVSEATIDSTYFETDTVDLSSDRLIPIGRPIANTQIYILDKHLQPVPIGVPGELYIGGDGLARGYLNRPALTQQKFIPNPFVNSQSERLYKTGDLARYLPDGNIEFLGRVDNQVKIRGFRIELGEIEAALNSHPQIQQAIVIATEEISGNKRLVAYVVSNGGSITTKQLTEFLKQKLPGYMVPSVFVILDTLPLTPNGKVDRKALPLPDGEISREYHYVAPRTPSEEIIANIFTDVLSVQNVGIHDNFFELGGHSLLATQLISRLRVAFEVEIELRKVFEFPTVAQLEQTLTQLRTQEQGLSLPPIQPRTTSEQLPLSFAQERLWFLNQLEGASATYNIAGAIRISGNLDISALQQALSEIVHRHEVLRTSFLNVNGTPIQVIHPQATINIKVVDLQQLQATEREIVLQQQVQLEANTPFDLETAPLIRCSLWQLDSREYVLLLNMHHIVSDGWSIGIFTQELSSLYQAFGAGEPSPLAELPIQYADFAVWQRQWLSGQVLETQLNYWVSQLEGAPELLQLPTDCPRPVMQTYRGATYDFSIDADLTQKLQALSRKSGTTLFMTLLATFATLLYRYSGQSDILIGSPIANRNQSQIESLIGFFVNTLVLRNRFEDHPSFEELLAQVRETTLKAYEYQDVPFEQVVEVLQPRRSLSHSPLFQVMFVLQNAPLGKLELPGCSWCELDQQSTIAKFDLTLSITETNQGLLGSWEYNTDLFDGSTIERMAGHFHNLLSAIVENPQQKVSELPLLSAAERHQLLVAWNDTECEYPTDKCIHQLFEQQVERTPDAVAVFFEDEQLTYQQLNQKANQLAHHLLSLGVGPEVLVGICVERSLEMVVGLLGILKAGGAYVPLDPTYPQERLSYMLADSGVEVLLTQQSLLSSLPQNQAQAICLDSDWRVIEQHSQENLDVEVRSDNLAYVIYTSGSTGIPKGAMNTQQGISNRLLWMRKAYPLVSSDRVLQKTPFSFDVSVWEFFWPLLTGARIVVAQPEGHKDSTYLVHLISQQQITTIHFVPSMLQVFLLEPNLENCSCLKRVFCSGEALPFELTQHFFSKLECELHNLYGPTEAAIEVTFRQCQPQENLHIVPIGRPIANTQIYILDKHLQPVPIGVAGELYIGGNGLARGYLNRPELTQEKFIQNPFCNFKSERLYKTGDLARYLPDGNIEFLGRIDHQVKIRGFRIELGEIEAVLTTHPQIQQAVVIATEDTVGKKCLVAYVVSEGKLLSTNQIRQYLKQKLPEYMVPSVFVTLDTLPLTPNGKVDRKALPAPDVEISREQEYVAPRTPTEEIIANIFANVLGVQNVGIHDNFFELGGHSLLAIRLISQIQQKFPKNLSLATLFQNPTIEQLANLLHSSVNTQNSILIPIKTSGNQPPLFCIHPVGGNVLCYADLVCYLDQNYPVYGLQSLGLDGQQEPLTNVEEMASYYLEAIQQIQPQGPLHLIGWSMGGVIAYEMAQQLQARNEPVALLTLIDSYAPTVITLPSELDQAMIINQLAQDWGSLYGQELDISLETIRQLEPDEQVKHLFEQAKQQAIFPSEIPIEQMLSLWKVFQANITANYAYQPQSYSGSILLLNSSETRPEVTKNPIHGWGSLVLGEIEIHTITGDHYNIMKAPQVEYLAEKLNNHLQLIQNQQYRE